MCVLPTSLCNKQIFAPLIMSSFTPEKGHIREAWAFCFHLKHSATKSRRLLMEAYGDSALSEKCSGTGPVEAKMGILI